MPVQARYTIRRHKKVRKDTEGFPADAIEVVNHVVDGLVNDPRPHGYKPLRGYAALFRVKASGHYRVVYEINDTDHLVTVLMVAHRKEVYNLLEQRFR